MEPLAEPTTAVVPWSFAGGRLRLLDQRRLPHEELWLECETALETAEASLALGRNGAEWIKSALGLRGTFTLLTHCNAGALATAGIGTALGVVRALARERPVTVLADETRPFLQGARLTAWELRKDGIE